MNTEDDNYNSTDYPYVIPVIINIGLKNNQSILFLSKFINFLITDNILRNLPLVQVLFQILKILFPELIL